MQKLKKVYKSDIFRTLIINVLYFLLFTVFLFPYYEENDDNSLSNIVSGAYGKPSSRMIHTNIVVGKFLSTLTELVPTIKWYTVFLYCILFLSFCVLTYVIIKRCGYFGLYGSIIILTYFGYECYVAIQFTKTAGLASVAGMIAIIYVLEGTQRNWVLLFIGSILAVCGSMIRFDAFGMVLVLMSIMGIAGLLSKYMYNRADKKKGILEGAKYIFVFFVIFLLAGGLKYYDYCMYEYEPEWKVFKEFDEKRSDLLDYGIPPYSEHAEEYAKINVSENDLKMLSDWNFADPDFYSSSLLNKILLLREHKNGREFGDDDIKYFFSYTMRHFFIEKAFCAFLIVLLFWFVMSRKNWSIVISTLLVVMGLNIYLQYMGRVLLNRVDVTIWLAASAVIIYVSEDCLTVQKQNKFLIVFAMLLLIINSNSYLDHIDAKKADEEQKKRRQEFCEAVAGDAENLYLVDTASNVVIEAYQVFDSVLWGMYENYYVLGGWETYSPAKLNTLYSHGVSNPFRDVINSNNIYLIDNCGGIDNKITYIREHYDANVQATLVKQYGGNNIYKIDSIDLDIDISDAVLDDSDVFSYVTVSEDGDNITVDGTVYIPGENSFQQNIYLMLTDKENGKTKYLYTCQKESSSRENIYDGKYANFTGIFNKAEIDMDNLRIEVILDSGGQKYKVGVDDYL